MCSCPGRTSTGLFELDKTDPIGGGCELASVLNGKLPRAFAKLYDTRTRVDRPYLKPIGGPHLWIDILPVDGLPGNERACRRLLRLRTFLEMHNLAAMWKVGTGHRKKMILQYAARYPLAMLVESGAGRAGWTVWAAACLTRRRPRWARWSARAYGPGEAMPKARFEIPVEVEFEGRRVPDDVPAIGNTLPASTATT